MQGVGLGMSFGLVQAPPPYGGCVDPACGGHAAEVDRSWYDMRFPVVEAPSYAHGNGHPSVWGAVGGMVRF